jgi:cathepsin A (carboxypeptidase C)
MYLIQDKDISKNFKGMAIGNGALSNDYLTNSIPPLLYEHALVGERIWENMTADCCKGNGISCDYVDILNTGGKGNDCFRQVATISIIPQISSLDPYNLYDTCYVDTSLQNRKRTVYYKMFLKRMGLNYKKAEEIIRQAPDYMKRQKLSSSQKPDCYYDGITLYLQREDVRKAIHIPDSVPAWEECVDFNYVQQYDDMAYQLKTTMNANVRILIYNGDCDTVCNAMGDKQFIDSLGREQLNLTYPWFYKQDYQNQNAGWQTLYDGIHFISVRGSGHFVPMDKPREALQMITNFIRNQDYSTPTGIDVTPQPLTTNISQSIRSFFWLYILSIFIAVATARRLF